MGKLVESSKIVLGQLALLNTAGFTTSAAADYVSMKKYDHLVVIIGLAPASGMDTAVITLKQATDVDNSKLDEKALAFTSAWRCPYSSIMDALTETTYASSITTSAAAEAELFVLEVDSQDLDLAGGFYCVRADVTDPGSVSTPAFCLYILSGCRYQSEPLPSAIID